MIPRLPTLEEWISTLKQEMYEALKTDDVDKAKRCLKALQALQPIERQNRHGVEQ